MVEIRWCHISPSMVAMDRWVTTGSLIFSLRRVARVATLVFSFTGRPAIGMAATWDGLICFDYFDLLFVDVCCLGCLWICFSETGKKHVLYRVATLSSLTLRPTSYDLRQHCSKTHHSSDPKGWTGHKRVSYVQEVWSGPVEKVLVTYINLQGIWSGLA